MKKEEIKDTVRKSYAGIARRGSSCCGVESSCCSSSDAAQDISKKVGYTDGEMKSVPEGANLGLGCGNPVAIASLTAGEVVLDLGSGAGFDSFLAADKVGRNGKVIGVDMTPEMVDRAKRNAAKGDYPNVEFRLGEIEHLPVADNSVDVVISNCVINLSTDKSRVFSEALRVLRPGGRMMVSDVVLTKDLPEVLKNSDIGYVGCISGAMLKSDYLKVIHEAGFRNVEVVGESVMPLDGWVNDPIANSIIEALNISHDQVDEIIGSVLSIRVRAVK